MNYREITYHSADDVAVITLNRPEVMNALTSRMRGELLDAIGTAATRAKVIVLTGAGQAFCSGQDLSDAQSASGMDPEAVLRDEYTPMIRAIVEARVPVIAAVNGAAAGAGANLALAADVVIAAESAVFLQAFSRIGLIPDAGGTWWLPRQIGMARSMGAVLFAEPVTAGQAAAWGMIWEAVADEDFAGHWRARAAQLARGPSVALAAAKAALRASPANSLTDQLALEARLQGTCARTADFREGIAAFLEKRPPAFSGR